MVGTENVGPFPAIRKILLQHFAALSIFARADASQMVPGVYAQSALGAGNR